jgi:hypothetical protein
MASVETLLAKSQVADKITAQGTAAEAALLWNLCDMAKAIS